MNNHFKFVKQYIPSNIPYFRKMDVLFFEQLHADGKLSAGSLSNIKKQEKEKLFSLHQELKTILYLGIFMLTTGLGLLVYKNIDTIGHQVIVIIIAAITIGCFFYCSKQKLPFSTSKVEAPNSFFDYILLLGCLCLIILIGYLQFQYNLFGNRYGLAAFIPMVILFFAAYYYDHLGVLAMAITNLASWAGIAVTPMRLLKDNDFNNVTIIYTALLLGLVLLLAGYAATKKNIKLHFAFTYSNFGAHLLFISCLAGLFHFDTIYLLWFLLLLALGYFFYIKALREKSFYYLLIMSLYEYTGAGYVLIRLVFKNFQMDTGGVYITLLYFIFSAIGIVLFLISMNKKIKTI